MVNSREYFRISDYQDLKDAYVIISDSLKKRLGEEPSFIQVLKYIMEYYSVERIKKIKNQLILGANLNNIKLPSDNIIDKILNNDIDAAISLFENVAPIYNGNVEEADENKVDPTMGLFDAMESLGGTLEVATGLDNFEEAYNALSDSLDSKENFEESKHEKLKRGYQELEEAYQDSFGKNPTFLQVIEFLKELYGAERVQNILPHIIAGAELNGIKIPPKSLINNILFGHTNIVFDALESSSQDFNIEENNEEDINEQEQEQAEEEIDYDYLAEEMRKLGLEEEFIELQISKLQQSQVKQNYDKIDQSEEFLDGDLEMLSDEL